MAFTPYADGTYATAYLANKLSWQVLPWTNASSGDKSASLYQATVLIDKLNFAGDKHDDSLDSQGKPNQVNQFPRGTDAAVPDDVQAAAVEIALKLLDQVDVDFEVENLDKTHLGMEGARIARDASVVQEHTRAGIPSLVAWELLKPYLRDPRHAIVLRES